MATLALALGGCAVFFSYDDYERRDASVSSQDAARDHVIGQAGFPSLGGSAQGGAGAGGSPPDASEDQGGAGGVSGQGGAAGSTGGALPCQTAENCGSPGPCRTWQCVSNFCQEVDVAIDNPPVNGPCPNADCYTANCDGKGECQFAPPGTFCSYICSGNNAVVGSCDIAGNCTHPGPGVLCDPYGCAGLTGCWGSCSSSSQCAAGYVCVNPYCESSDQ